MTEAPIFRRGNYRVTRWCCTSGLCCECHARGNHGNTAKRQRVVQTDRVSKAWAARVVAGWNVHGFEPAAERM